MIPIFLFVLSECAPSASSFYLVLKMTRSYYYKKSLLHSGFVCLSCNPKAMFDKECLNCSLCRAGFYRNLEYNDDFCQPCPAGKSQKWCQLRPFSGTLLCSKAPSTQLKRLQIFPASKEIYTLTENPTTRTYQAVLYHFQRESNSPISIWRLFSRMLKTGDL